MSSLFAGFALMQTLMHLGFVVLGCK